MYQASDARYSSMPYHRCGKSGLLLPAVSLGFWHNFGDTGRYETMKQLCFTAFDHGITHFDLANNYGPEPGSAEKNLGRILHENFMPYRDELIISTKAGYTMWDGPYGDWGSRKYLLASLDQSLQRLGLDYVDIYYHHRMDPNTPLEETMGALATAVQSGKAIYAGLSNYNGETLEKATAILNELHVPFVINQNRYSIFDRTIEKNGLKETANRLGKGIIAFSPLAQGLLTDRYLHGIPADSRVRTDGRFLKESALTEEKLAQIRALRRMQAQGGGTILNVASSAGLLPGGPYMAGYYASKAYVVSLTRGAAQELREKRSPVYVCALCPGPVNTEFNDRAGVVFALKGITPEFCVDEAIHGMLHHKTIIVPSAFMRLCTSAQKLLPTPLLMPIVARQQKKKLG